MNPVTSRLDIETAVRARGLDPGRMPRHVAIIMDGNGRWAQQRGWRRLRGHREGARTVHAITTESVELGIDWLTLFAFSSENWARPRREVDTLMRLLEDYLAGEVETLHRNNVRLVSIGRTDRLPDGVRRTLHEVQAATADHRAMTLCLALSYGGREEVVDACRQLAGRVANGDLAPEDIDQDVVGGALYAPDAPDVDLLVRTAGEQRLSNFLLWQSHYAEYVRVDGFWPDFSIDDYRQALREYQSRNRRFGRVPIPT
jgi:undecaprenyl diphosphate synthase